MTCNQAIFEALLRYKPLIDQEELTPGEVIRDGKSKFSETGSNAEGGVSGFLFQAQKFVEVGTQLENDALFNDLAQLTKERYGR